MTFEAQKKSLNMAQNYLPFVTCFFKNRKISQFIPLTLVNSVPLRKKATHSASATAPSASLDDHVLKNSGQGCSNPKSLKPFSEMPGSRGYPVIGNSLQTAKDISRWHLRHIENVNKYGGVWRDHMGVFGHSVFVANPEGIRNIAECEGKYPDRMIGPSWLEYYKNTDKEPGLLQSIGEQWWTQRQISSKPLLRPKDVANYVPAFVATAQDLVEIMASEKEDVKDIKDKLFRWSLESSCTVLYDRRLGCLDKHPPEEALVFIKSVHDMFKAHAKIRMLSPFLARIFYPKEKKTFSRSMDVLFSVATKETENRIRRNDEAREDTLMSQILREKTISRNEVDSILTDLMLAAVDTTSQTLHSILYYVASRPDIQEKMYQEISAVVSLGEELMYHKLDSLTYLTGVIKEATRLFPVGIATVRKLPPEGGIINGYVIPGNTQVFISIYGLGRNEAVFRNATEFIPERWIRSHNDQSLRVDPHAFAVFGVGVRSCIGKRVALTEIKVLCVELLRRFKFSTKTPEFEVVFEQTLYNPNDIQLTMTERQQA